MSRPISLQVYVTSELAGRVRIAAAADGLAVSEWLCSVIFRACEDEISVTSDRGLLRRLYRQSLFSMVGVDALLAGHKDHALRERVHQAFAAKCKQAGLTASTDEGGSHEA